MRIEDDVHGSAPTMNSKRQVFFRNDMNAFAKLAPKPTTGKKQPQLPASFLARASSGLGR